MPLALLKEGQPTHLMLTLDLAHFILTSSRESGLGVA